MATPEWCGEYVRSTLGRFRPTGAFMRFSTLALACCSGMSIYFTSADGGDGVQQLLRDFYWD